MLQRFIRSLLFYVELLIRYHSPKCRRGIKHVFTWFYIAIRMMRLPEIEGDLTLSSSRTRFLSDRAFIKIINSIRCYCVANHTCLCGMFLSRHLEEVIVLFAYFLLLLLCLAASAIHEAIVFNRRVEEWLLLSHERPFHRVIRVKLLCSFASCTSKKIFIITCSCCLVQKSCLLFSQQAKNKWEDWGHYGQIGSHN